MMTGPQENLLEQVTRPLEAEITRLTAEVERLTREIAAVVALHNSGCKMLVKTEAERDEARSLYVETEERLALLQSPRAVEELQEQVADAYDERDAALAREQALRAEADHWRNMSDDARDEGVRIRADRDAAIARAEKAEAERDKAATDALKVVIQIRDDRDAALAREKVLREALTKIVHQGWAWYADRREVVEDIRAALATDTTDEEPKT